MANPQKTDITVIRPFRYQGVVAEKGDHLSVDRHFAGEMISANKAVDGHVKLGSDKKGSKGKSSGTTPEEPK